MTDQFQSDTINTVTNQEYRNHLYALIIAGGGGTRLWPVSRNKTPKQFLKLFNRLTLTQITANRFNRILPWEKIYVVTVSEEYKKEIKKELPQMLSKNIIVEPARRETGPAHGLGAMYIYKQDPQAVIITEAADRLAKPVPAYLKTLLAAARIAYDKRVMIAMGVEPRYPHTGYGHIKKGKLVEKVKGVKFFKLSKFVEKPVLKLAKKYTASGKYLWNAGEFVWRADVILNSLSKNAPDVAKPLAIIGDSIGKANEEAVVKKQYENMPKIAIDYAVAEKDKNFLVVEGDFFWTDIGDWKEVWENLNKDEQGNVIIDGHESGGEVKSIDTTDTLIHTDGRLIAVIGVDNVVVVDTKEALLVVSKSRAQNVKQIVEELKKQNREELL